MMWTRAEVAVGVSGQGDQVEAVAAVVPGATISSEGTEKRGWVCERIGKLNRLEVCYLGRWERRKVQDDFEASNPGGTQGKGVPRPLTLM